MAVTINDYGNVANKPTAVLYGLSTDTKPVREINDTPIVNGSVFIEMDTGDAFFYDEENELWKEV